jgi:Cytochrome P450
MFSTVEHGPHSAKKRLMSNIYSKSYLQGSAQVHENSLILLRDRFLPFIQEASMAKNAVDVHDMNNGFTMDFMSAYQFGLACSTKLSIDPSAKQRCLQQYHSRKEYEFHAQEIPRLMAGCKWLGIPLVPKEIEDANDFIEDMGMKMCDSANAYLDDLPSPGAEPVVYKQFKNGLAKQWQKLDGQASRLETEPQRLEVASEMLDHLSAGHETSAIALTYLYYEMSRRLDLQERLRQELLTLSPQIIWQPTAALELPSPKSVDALPLLHAIIMETLRLHAPIPGLEPRITPAGGCTLAGYAIPAQVRVSAMPYALHRNGHVFPDPESWKPERWLNASETEMKEMLRWFWAFGSGGRMCIGSNLAMQEIKLIVTAIYTNWRTMIVDDEGIEEIDAYTTRPRSNRLILRFKHL